MDLLRTSCPSHHRLSKLHHFTQGNLGVPIGIVDVEGFEKVGAVDADLWLNKFKVSYPVRNVEFSIPIHVECGMEKLFEGLLLNQACTSHQKEQGYCPLYDHDFISIIHRDNTVQYKVELDVITLSVRQIIRYHIKLLGMKEVKSAKQPLTQSKPNKRPRTRRKGRSRNKIRIYQGERKINLLHPAKFVGITLPTLPPLPSQLNAFVTKSPFLSYDLSSKLVTISQQQFFDPQINKEFHLSIAQQQIHPQTIPGLVSLNLSSIYKTNLWYYPQNRVVNYHYDSHDNFLFVLSGKKIVHLKKPGSLPCEGVFSVNGNQSISRGLIKYDYRVVVRAGECVYIPCGWFHKIYSVGRPVIGINYWGNSVAELPASKHQVYLKYLISLIAQKRTAEFLKGVLENNPSLKQRKERIMSGGMEQLKELQLSTPFDYQILAERLEANSSGMEEIWSVVDYHKFQEQKKEIRKRMFLMYLDSIL